ncbi:MAG: hypothetical protein IPI44_04200 [Sulfuritalea sp.]|nr:hypothetical protein [Sulfuritalea sp.]MBK8120727.1 hypothetical protein [Sulfuritalea sp.]
MAKDPLPGARTGSIANEPHRILRKKADLDAWVADARKAVLTKLADGPVSLYLHHDAIIDLQLLLVNAIYCLYILHYDAKP